jgi:hypothetical protein
VYQFVSVGAGILMSLIIPNARRLICKPVELGWRPPLINAVTNTP